jgi:hypothetical protein
MAPHGPWSGPVHGSVRNGSARSIFGCKENRPAVGPDQGKARDGLRSGHGPVRDGLDRVGIFNILECEYTLYRSISNASGYKL